MDAFAHSTMENQSEMLLAISVRKVEFKPEQKIHNDDEDQSLSCNMRPREHGTLC